MPHGDTVVYCDGIEFCSKTTELFNLRLYLLSELMQMHMPRNKLSK